jgi:hypothetical protein
LRKWFLCMWGSLALKPDTNSYFFRQGLLLRDKMTIFTDSKHVLWYLKMVILTFFKQCVFLDIYTDNILLPW